MSGGQKMVNMGDLFDDADFKAAVAIRATDPGNFHARCVTEIVQPKLSRIEEKVGQKMNAGYLAYQLEYALGPVGA
jgi:hypothetical protein